MNTILQIEELSKKYNVSNEEFIRAGVILNLTDEFVNYVSI
ncbi:hypothetical protein GMMP15_720005 [Candidatus Magnetomoraceae bacterium gMMP-15]